MVHLLVILVGLPFLIHVLLTIVAVTDAQSIGMNHRRWALIVFAIPLFGFFAYLFERSERNYDPATDPYRRRDYNFHERYQDDEPDN